MYKSFRVRNFRGLHDLKVSSLDRINLIAGKNNIGKTALLEALFLHYIPNNPDIGLRIDNFRGLEGFDPQEPLYDLFWSFDTELDIEFRAMGDWNRSSRTLVIKLMEVDVSQVNIGPQGSVEPQPQPESSVASIISKDKVVLEYVDEFKQRFTSEAWVIEAPISLGVQGQAFRSRREGIGRAAKATYLGTRQGYRSQQDAERFGRLEVEGRHGSIEDVLRRVDPRIKRLTVVPRVGIPVIHAEIEGSRRLLPLPLLGDGMVKLSSLALAIGDARDGMILVDEIDNGLHHSVLESVWIGIAEFAREFNVQVFATTHSKECIRAAHDAFSSDNKYDFRLHRLERVKETEEIRSVTYDKETLDIALLKELEVR